MSTSKGDPEGTYAGIYFDDSSIFDRKLFALSASEATSYFDSDAERLSSGWWLRSFFFGDNYAGFVNSEGAVGVFSPFDLMILIRPAFNLNLSSVLFSSAAAGGKSIPTEDGLSSGADGIATIFEIPSNATNMWKLTLRDSSRGFTAAPTASDAASDALTAA